VFSACVAAVKCRPVLHHCVVIFFRSSGVMDSMLFTFENRVRSCSRGVSGVASFITTDEAASIKPRLLFSHEGYAA